MNPTGSVESEQHDGGLALLQREEHYTQCSSSVIQQLNCNGCSSCPTQMSAGGKKYSLRFACIHYPPYGKTARVLLGEIVPSVETLAEASAEE
ncbi:hypothetical protein PBY51_002384 [Eleginops maclovinus]|uniref:Uncharacterized protein n=1 Tax=Eleginops maclovinus TaxID=56733 RepID=A0AAN7XB85_ELEMC|nr:hypothetical protein PBY51_002384 [Eleginops maclovinus]